MPNIAFSVVVDDALVRVLVRTARGRRASTEALLAQQVWHAATFAWELLSATLAANAAVLLDDGAQAQLVAAAEWYVQAALLEFVELTEARAALVETALPAELMLVVTHFRQRESAAGGDASAAYLDAPDASDAALASNGEAGELARQLALALDALGYGALAAAFKGQISDELARLLLGAFRFELEREPNPVLPSGGLEPGARPPKDEYAAALARLSALRRCTPRYSGVVPHRESSPPAVPDENVQFTVYRPRVIDASRWHTLLAFAHLSEKRASAAEDECDPLEQVEREADAELGPQLPAYQKLVEDTRHPIPPEGVVTFVPLVPGIEFNPPRASILWSESVHKASFRMRAAPTLEGKTARGDLSVYLGGILVADLQLAISVDSKRARAKGKSPALVRDEAAKRYRRIFASYSHADAEVVARVQGFAKALGDEYLMDTINLRAGEHWDEALRSMIEQADVFQLFWSWSSMSSEFVRREWEHALSLGRPNFVRPTYWQTPMPESADRALPPPELAQLHFQHIAPNIAPARPEVPEPSAGSARSHAFALLSAGLGVALLLSAGTFRWLGKGASPRFDEPLEPNTVQLAPTNSSVPILPASTAPPEELPTALPVQNKPTQPRAPAVDPHRPPVPKSHEPTGPEPKANGVSGGPRDPSELQSIVVHDAANAKRTCWGPAVARRDPGAPPSARVSVTFQIAPNGSVQNATIGSDPPGYPGLASCIASQVHGWHFPPSDEPTTVNVPFVFAQDSSPPPTLGF